LHYTRVFTITIVSRQWSSPHCCHMAANLLHVSLGLLVIS